MAKQLVKCSTCPNKVRRGQGKRDRDRCDDCDDVARHLQALHGRVTKNVRANTHCVRFVSGGYADKGTG